MRRSSRRPIRVVRPETGRSEKDSKGHLRKLGKKFGIVEKEVDKAENDVYDTRHENFPVGSVSDSLMWNCVCNGWRRRNAAAIGLINLSYHLFRYEQMVRLKLRPRTAA